MRHVITLLAILAAFTLATVGNAGIVGEAQSTAGTGETATITLHNASQTTAYAVGVWSSTETPTPVHITYTIACTHPANNKYGSFDLLAGRYVSDAAYLWAGSPNIAGPFYGWDTCDATVGLTQTAGGNDFTLIGWLNSHNGT